MALIACPDCNANISTSALACPHCGRPAEGAAAVPLPTRAGPPADILGWTLVALPVLGAVALVLVPSGFTILATVAACALVTFFDARRLGLPPTQYWAPMAFFWMIGYPLYLGSRAKVGPKRLVPGIISMCVFGASLALFSGVGSRIDANCNVTGSGTVTCSFINIGWAPGAGCVLVRLTNEAGVRIESSGPICSGRIAPSKTGDASGNILGSPLRHCLGNHSPLEAMGWSKFCTVEVVSASR